jgi:hypothetical protein
MFKCLLVCLNGTRCILGRSKETAETILALFDVLLSYPFLLGHKSLVSMHEFVLLLVFLESSLLSDDKRLWLVKVLVNVGIVVVPVAIVLILVAPSIPTRKMTLCSQKLSVLS